MRVSGVRLAGFLFAVNAARITSHLYAWAPSADTTRELAAPLLFVNAGRDIYFV